MKIKTYSEYCQTFKMECFARRQGEGFVELRNFDKYFVKNTRKRGTARKHFGVFSPRYS